MYNPITFNKPIFTNYNPVIIDYFSNIRNVTYNNEYWVNISNILPHIRPCYFISSYGRVYSNISHKILKTRSVGRGYEIISLYKNEGGKMEYLIHRLVLLAFSPIDNPELYQGNHKDGIKTNNYLYNLEWNTQSENMLHSYAMGLRKPGENHMFNSLFTESEVHMICKSLQDGLSYRKICTDILYIKESDIINKCIYNIRLIHQGKNWKHISKYYDFT